MNDADFMRLAIEEAKKAKAENEVPVGAVVVFDGKVIAAAHNLREGTGISTAHAEILAIEKANRALSNWRLCGASIFVTLEPCAMCAGAILQSRIDRLVFGAYSPEGAVISKAGIFDEFGSKIQILGGFMQDECKKLLENSIGE